jgi:2-dehydropantoate 2-reductase
LNYAACFGSLIRAVNGLFWATLADRSIVSLRREKFRWSVLQRHRLDLAQASGPCPVSRSIVVAIQVVDAMSAELSRQTRSLIAVIGIGSVGGVMAGSLLAAGRHDVIACSRNPLERLVLDRPGGTINAPIRTLTDPAAAEPVDWVLLCTKAQQTPSSAAWLARLCDGRTRVAVLQNGIEHKRRVALFAGEATVVPTIVYYNGERIAANHVLLRQVSDHDLAVRDDADGRAFAALLAGTSLRVRLSSDFETLAWRKLLINVVANPITALTLQRQAVLRRDDVRSLCLDILDEAVAVARAAGACLADDEGEHIMATLCARPPGAGTSMYFDRVAGQSLEADALTGAVVAVGERHGIATPLNRALLTLLRAISEASEIKR